MSHQYFSSASWSRLQVVPSSYSASFSSRTAPIRKCLLTKVARSSGFVMPALRRSRISRASRSRSFTTRGRRRVAKTRKPMPRFVIHHLTQPRQLLQQPPVLQPVLLGVQQRLGRVAVLVEVLGEPPLAAGEVDERHLLVRLRVDEPVALDVRVALERQPLLDRVAG